MYASIDLSIHNPSIHILINPYIHNPSINNPSFTHQPTHPLTNPPTHPPTPCACAQMSAMEAMVQSHYYHCYTQLTLWGRWRFLGAAR